VDYLPIFLTIRNRSCLVVGGGQVAARKVALLLEAGGRVTVIAPKLCQSLQKLCENERLIHLPGSYSAALLAPHTVVIAATDDAAVNAEVSALCQSRGIPVNVVDQPRLCSFIMPAIVDRAPVLIALSTGGTSPVLARLLRARLESLIPAGYGRLAALAASFREKVRHRLPPSRRRSFWERVLQGPIAELALAGHEAAARRALETALADSSRNPSPASGEVYLVGAGPGDPDLLTFRALRLMQQADVVLYDRLVSPAILAMVRRDAERLYVGKARGNHSLAQAEINRLLVQLAKSGKRVLRLKGGDPFIFGRGGEEIEKLSGAGIPFQVVPGITAASGCAAYAGIPLTHRDYAQSCVFVTGHLRDGVLNLNWEALAQAQQTVVFYMGLHAIEIICTQLVKHGLPATTPAALVERGTTAAQRVWVGTLANLPQQSRAAEAKFPSLIIVGHVVRLREQLAWFEPQRAEDAVQT
jgi:uroporphyrin-III C-methyltransferase/precorrin-2 dehydrogenase/sirohydrochlorin ferrochelatase